MARQWVELAARLGTPGEGRCALIVVQPSELEQGAYGGIYSMGLFALVLHPRVLCLGAVSTAPPLLLALLLQLVN